jgi:hypothetical protein
MDISLYDKGKHSIIAKKEYPDEVKEFFSRFAKTEGITYGGDWQTPDENHLEYNRNQSVAQRSKEFEEFVKEKQAKEKTKPLTYQTDGIVYPVIYPELPTNGTAIDYDKLEHNKKLEQLAKERQAKEKPEHITGRVNEFEEETIYRDDPLKYPKKVALRAFEYSQEFVDKSPTNISGKEKEHSFYEPDYKSRDKENANPQPVIDYRQLAEAIKDALRGDQQETNIIIQDKTQGGISAEQSNYASRNANLIFK